MYDGAMIISSDKNSHTGPPIPLSERPSRPPAGLIGARANTAEAYMVTTPICNAPDGVLIGDYPDGSGSNTVPLVAAGRNIMRGVKSGYMSLKNVQKPNFPWKGPHGERYNLDGYTELQQVVPNKSNNASTSSMRRSASENILGDNSDHDVQIWSRSLPSTLVSFPSAADSAAADYDNPPSSIGYDYSVMSVNPEAVYYHQLEEGDNSTMASSMAEYAVCSNMDGVSGASNSPSASHPPDSSSSPGATHPLSALSASSSASAGSPPYYYKLQPDGEAVVTFVANRGCESNAMSPNCIGDDDVFIDSDLQSSDDVDRQGIAASQSERRQSDGSSRAGNETTAV